MAKGKGKHYAWSDLYNGGEAETIPVAGGRAMRTVVKSRNIIKRGEVVTQSDLGVDDEVWDHLCESGSVRPYPLPEGANDYVSPTAAILQQVADPRTGDVSVDTLLELGLTQPPINPPADEGAELKNEE